MEGQGDGRMQMVIRREEVTWRIGNIVEDEHNMFENFFLLNILVS